MPPHDRIVFVKHSRIYLDENGELLENVRISSAPRYDQNLIKAFPHFAEVSFQTAEVFSASISAGLSSSTYGYGYPSFASTMNFNGGPYGSKVMWLSDSALITLKENLRGEYSFEDVPEEDMWITPTHRRGE